MKTDQQKLFEVFAVLNKRILRYADFYSNGPQQSHEICLLKCDALREFRKEIENLGPKITGYAEQKGDEDFQYQRSANYEKDIQHLYYTDKNLEHELLSLRRRIDAIEKVVGLQ